MGSYPLVFTVLFMLLGPLKTIGPFAAVTRDADKVFQRAVAIRATLVSAALMAFVAFSGRNLLVKFQISTEALYIAGGLVLLLAALRTMFGAGVVPDHNRDGVSAVKLAASPVASPIIVTPAGVAAILIFALLAPRNPGMMQTMAVSLAIILVLNFLVMYFNRAIAGTAPLMLVLQLLGSVLVFIQVALSIDTILEGLKMLGLAHGAGPA